jgi:hypothetical protein
MWIYTFILMQEIMKLTLKRLIWNLKELYTDKTKVIDQFDLGNVEFCFLRV